MRVASDKFTTCSLSMCKAFFIFIFGTLNFFQIAIGVLYLFECPHLPFLPIFLIAMGGMNLAVHFLQSLHVTSQRRDAFTMSLSVCAKLLCWVQTCCLIIGSIWIFTKSTPSFTPGDPQYCSKTVYLFTIATIVINYIVLTPVILSICIQLYWCGTMLVQDRPWNRGQAWRAPI
ncbi:hypothetical protein JZ751_027541 [Albula glossodonta]|uniref:Uncharacterized protein n=1 Tax=Albula glossodonta TaxID=121402 RepID=A0A8T2NC53_9TELE|nr:hypothetical protein JZ751_027541 [Albula glossodonta]